MLRNGDERFRELERMVEAGDAQAAITLLREETRRGIERDHYDDAKFVVETPLGGVSFAPQNERTIYVQIGERDVEIGTGNRDRRRKVTLVPVEINRVPHYGNIHYHYYDEASFSELVRGQKPEHWSFWLRDMKTYVPGFAPYTASRRELNDTFAAEVHPSLYLKRSDRRMSSNDDASDSAKKKFLAIMTPIVNQWASSHKREMLEAEAGSANNRIVRQMEEYREALEKLTEIESLLGAQVVREAQARAELRSMS